MPKKEIIYGIGPVFEMLRAGRRRCHAVFASRDTNDAAAGKVIAAARKLGTKIVELKKSELGSKLKGENHQGVAAEVDEFEYVDSAEIVSASKTEGGVGFVVILDGITDPHNLGSIIRSAHLFGVDGIILPQDNSASITPTVAKTSAGALEYVKIAQVTNINREIDRLKKIGFWVAGADGESGENVYLHDFKDENIAIIFGSEGRGLRRLVREKCDYLLSIPMKGVVGSYNASVAAALMIGEVARQRWFLAHANSVLGSTKYLDKKGFLP
jgi:23S rRNA (guanosine2251-2'-O)-methyltransferase